NETLGPRTYAPPPQPFLTGTTANRVEASETTEREIDLAVREIVVKAFDRATEVLRARRADLDEGARLLLAQETVTADQFPAILPAARATRVNWLAKHVVSPDSACALRIALVESPCVFASSGVFGGPRARPALPHGAAPVFLAPFRSGPPHVMVLGAV